MDKSKLMPVDMSNLTLDITEGYFRGDGLSITIKTFKMRCKK